MKHSIWAQNLILPAIMFNINHLTQKTVLMPIPIKCRENKSAWNKVKAQGDNMPIVSLRGEVAEEKGGQ